MFTWPKTWRGEDLTRAGLAHFREVGQHALTGPDERGGGRRGCGGEGVVS